MDEIEKLQDECDRLNAELPEDSEMVWMVRSVIVEPDRDPLLIYKSWNQD